MADINDSDDEPVLDPTTATAAKKKKKNKKKKKVESSNLPRGVVLDPKTGDLVWDEWAVKILGAENLQQHRRSVNPVTGKTIYGTDPPPKPEAAKKKKKADNSEAQEESDINTSSTAAAVEGSDNNASKSTKESETDEDDCWSASSTKMRRTQKQYLFSGSLRPWRVEKQQTMPDTMLKPDYATHPSGYCMEEQNWPDSVLI